MIHRHVEGRTLDERRNSTPIEWSEQDSMKKQLPENHTDMDRPLASSPAPESLLSDGEMIRQCLLRPPDQAAWQEFVRRYHQTIENSIRETLEYKIGLFVPEQEVTLLTQQVYRELIEDRCRQLRKVEGDFVDSLKPYLMLVAINIALNHARGDE